MNLVSTCMLRLHQKVKPNIETIFTKKIQDSDDIGSIGQAVSAQCEPGWMPAIMMHYSMQRT